MSEPQGLPPRPYHRWATNESVNRAIPPAYDRCLACGVRRYPGADNPGAERIASGPCPGARP